MAGDADLEIGLRWDRRREELYANLRFDVAGEAADDWKQPDEPIALDLAELKDASADEQKYGQALTRMLLRPDDIAPFYRRARDRAEAEEKTLHVRLHISAPPRYHAVHWESLRDPDNEDPIAVKSGVLLSRYLSSEYWRPLKPVPKHDLRGLVVVANPSDDGGRFNLAPVRVEEELERARTALNALSGTEELANGRATLAAMLDAIDDGVDVVYLVCHGAVIDDVPVIYLEASDGSVDSVDGRKLVERLHALDRRPSVVMLCSCQSATSEAESWSADGGTLSALGPKLAEAGVLAVVGMQGNVSMTTASVFAPRFFTELAKDGIVDRAMAVARRAVLDRRDWWVPVLFSRLRSGRTYYTPEFAKRAGEAWNALRLQIKGDYFIPVLGPGLADSIIGSRQEIARGFVERWQMPLAPHNQGDLAQVGQYLHVRSAPGTVRLQLLEHLDDVIAKRRERAREGDPWWDLPESDSAIAAFLEVGRRLRERDPGEPYRVMAALKVSLYVTTAWTDLLQDALRDAGRDPVTRSFPWNEQTDSNEPDHVPTEGQPLVYHLFGRLDHLGSLVLSEDDYFQWFIAWMTRRLDIPSVVQRRLIADPLLFLGFRLDDWDFRVIFNSLKSFGGSARWGENAHTGVQVSPESQVIDPQAAQEYLERYFGGKASIFWGDTRHFLDELRARTGLTT